MTLLIRNLQLAFFKRNFLSVTRQKVQETGKRPRKLKQEDGEYNTHKSTDK